MRFGFGYNRLSRDCSQSERDGCAQIQTTIYVPLPVYESHCRKGTAVRVVWGRPCVQDLRCVVANRLGKAGESQGIKGPGLELSFHDLYRIEGMARVGKGRSDRQEGVILVDPM